MVILQFDQNYHHWALLMVRSLQLHEPDTPVLADAVNLDREEVTDLEQAHRSITVLNDTRTWDETFPSQMAARKPFVLQRAMSEFPGHPWYGLFDADFLVRRSLKPLWALLDERSAALFRTNGMWKGKYYRKLVIPSGIVLLKPEGKELIDCWAKWIAHEHALESVAPGAWFWDQLALFEALEECGLSFTKIPMTQYADSALREDSAIWSAHVGNEKERYYDLFLTDHRRSLKNERATSA